MNLVLNVLIGGVDTSQSQLTHAVRLLASHPDQWELLASDPSLAASAADESRDEILRSAVVRIQVTKVVTRRTPAGTRML